MTINHSTQKEQSLPSMVYAPYYLNRVDIIDFAREHLEIVVSVRHEVA